MSAPLLLDLSHTSHTRARTGVQRVARALWRSLGDAAQPITFDPYARCWRPLEAWERGNLAAGAPASRRGAQWPPAARLRGRARRLLRRSPALPASDAAVLVPEIFSSSVASALPALFSRTSGPRVAVFHDAIALKLPELTPRKTVARFPGYLSELLMFDGVAAISEESRDTLVEYWRWLGAADTPVVRTIPLGIETPLLTDEVAPTVGAHDVRILSIGSIEGRKNHLALLDACEMLWAGGTRFDLHLIGLAHAETGRAAVKRIRSLQAAGRPLRYDGPTDDAIVARAYADCTFTIYPSLMEGFGLPVLESLAHGKPCICSAHGALGESARGGGCIMLPSVDAGSIAAAIRELVSNPAERRRLAESARARRFRTWTDYVNDLTNWMGTMRRRN
jgi:glycosyltransferase involved in cell wall biosynthesis